MKRRFTLFLLLTLVVALFTSGSIVLGKAPEVIEKDSALTKNKELLYYLFWTQDQKLEKDIADLQAVLRLSDEQVAALKNLGLEEHQSSVGLQTQAQKSRCSRSISRLKRSLNNVTDHWKKCWATNMKHLVNG